MIKIYVDANGCLVKNEVFRVALRYRLKVYVVSNSKIRIPEDDLFDMVLVKEGFDAAMIGLWSMLRKTISACHPIFPLPQDVLKKGARMLDPKGHVFTDESIGGALANRELMAHLRELGEITGAPAPFQKRDRSRFLERLDSVAQAFLRAPR